MKTKDTIGHKPKSLAVIFAACGLALLCSCSKKVNNPNKELTAQAFAQFENKNYKIDLKTIRRQLREMARTDNDSTQTDRLTRKLYRENDGLIWIDKFGIDLRADTLVSHLKNAGGIGFSSNAFYIDEIEEDMKRIRSLDFGQANDINSALARMEYRMTKAYLRYCTGQQFGFTNPYKSLNQLDPATEDTTAKVTEYKHLFDIPIRRPDDGFYKKALETAKTDELGPFLHSVEPQSLLFDELRGKLAAEKNARRRWLLLCNMERHRWKREPMPQEHLDRKVVVNIPAFRLYAYSPDSVMTMKVGCGATKTKTPLLTSAINRMDINPLWNIPMSIIRKDVAPHAGNTNYFTSRRYFIVDRKTGKTLQPSQVSASMLKSGQYRVSQEGGAGNSLGRIIFRFDNKFSVYLHDTSSRKFFDQNIRSVSHGCIRIERPFDFARFLLGNGADEWTLDKIRISMDMQPETEKGLKYISDTTRSRKLINSKKVSPEVPLYIIYQTLFKTPEGKWEEYGDIYGFDAVMRRQLEPFVKSKRNNGHRNEH